jgi:hypothetical protein
MSVALQFAAGVPTAALPECLPLALGVAWLPSDHDRPVATIVRAALLAHDDSLRGLLHHVAERALVVVPEAVHLAILLHHFNLPMPRYVSPIRVAATLMDLGLYHKNNAQAGPRSARGSSSPGSAADAREEASMLRQLSNRFRLRLDVPAAAGPFGYLTDCAVSVGPDDEIAPVNTLVPRAVACLRLHEPLTAALRSAGHSLRHLERVELPAAPVLASLEVQGVKIAVARVRDALRACDAALPNLGAALSGLAITDPWSDDQCRGLLSAVGMTVEDGGGRRRAVPLDKLRELGRFDDRVGLLFRYRAYDSARHGVLRQCLMLRDSKGRVHPQIRQLGSDTGRISMSRPNLLGLPRLFRPIVVPDGPEYGLAELDFVQQELGLCAAIFEDPVLLADFNDPDGDVYGKVARNVIASVLGVDLAGLADADIKGQHRDLRSKAKIVTNGLNYGMTAWGLAERLRVSEERAQVFIDGYFTRYSTLKKNMERKQVEAAIQGYVETMTGMRRLRAGASTSSDWELRWYVNTLVQGAGAALLKLLLPHVSAVLAKDGGRIVLPPHDSLLVQYRLDDPSVLGRVEAVMVEGFRGLCPQLRPRVEVNDKDPTCWNKDGHSDSIERFLEDPFFTV